jgi:hypothetical protein
VLHLPQAQTDFLNMINPTRLNPTPEQVAERQAFLEQNRIEASALSERLKQQQEQQREAEFQNRLVEATQLSLEQLRGIREWLKHNPI